MFHNDDNGGLICACRISSVNRPYFLLIFKYLDHQNFTSVNNTETGLLFFLHGGKCVCECDCEEAQYFRHIALLFPTEVIQILSHPKTDETIRYICILQKSLTLSSHGACANASELWGFPESGFQ